VLQTGAGANVLFEEAKRLGRLDELVDGLQRITIVARGPKPGAALSQRGLRAAVNAREPYTTAELLEAMAPLALDGTGLGIVHYGEPNDLLITALRDRKARLEELHVYQWEMPEDVEPLRGLVREIVAGRLQAIAFTSQIQARHLFQIAREIGLGEPLARMLNSTTVVASVGPTCSAVLRGLGIPPRVEPERPKMRPLVTALAQYLDQT
jgi:uroporphyrinogen-III synthase